MLRKRSQPSFAAHLVSLVFRLSDWGVARQVVDSGG